MNRADRRQAEDGPQDPAVFLLPGYLSPLKKLLS